MEEILRTILYEWQERKLPEIIPRDTKIELPNQDLVKKALVVTGFRRTGKTYLVFAIIKELLRSLNRNEVVYVNFEDERIPAETKILTDLVPAIQAVFGQKPKYLFLDEIQNIPGWSKWLRRMLDTQEIQLILTGSSSKLSSQEIATELRGRAWEIHLYPLSFSEFLRFKKEKLNWEKMKYLAEEKARFSFLFEEYLLYGGLPEVVLVPLAKKQELLQNYFQTVVKRDLIDRFQIRNEENLKTLLRLLLNSTYITVSKLYRTLKSMGYSIGKTTLNHYLSYIESSYFLKQLYFYSPSMKNQLQYPRKVYFVDNGFLTALSTKFSKNYGRLLENFVFWELNKQGKEVFYYKDERGNEVDFMIMEEGKVKKLIQVCFEWEDWETREREIKSLVKAGKKFNCPKLQIVTKAEKEGAIPKIALVPLETFIQKK